MLIKLITTIPGQDKPVYHYVGLSESTDNVLKITKRKLAAINRKWTKQTEGCTTVDEIFDKFYEILDDAEIDYYESGPDYTMVR